MWGGIVYCFWPGGHLPNDSSPVIVDYMFPIQHIAAGLVQQTGQMIVQLTSSSVPNTNPLPGLKLIEVCFNKNNNRQTIVTCPARRLQRLSKELVAQLNTKRVSNKPVLYVATTRLSTLYLLKMSLYDGLSVETAPIPEIGEKDESKNTMCM